MLLRHTDIQNAILLEQACSFLDTQSYLLFICKLPYTHQKREQARLFLREGVSQFLAGYWTLPASSIRLSYAPSQASYIEIATQEQWQKCESLKVSLAYCENYGVALLSAHPFYVRCGVDIEVEKDDLNESEWQSISLLYLGQSITQFIESLPRCQRKMTFYEAWTQYEAQLKALGLPMQEWNVSLEKQFSNHHLASQTQHRPCVFNDGKKRVTISYCLMK